MSNDHAIIDPMIRQLMESAAIGEAAKLFLSSDLGRHVTNRAADEVDEAISMLIEHDPCDAKGIAALQAKINVAKQSIVYLTEAIAEGENALRQLHDES